ncbi:hypothetical protein NMY22_g18206 [Coprinellus aureogranulatus]|nr:hypothetical protein NMY22_g18206 [Coprinellus aureogranulatus]
MHPPDEMAYTVPPRSPPPYTLNLNPVHALISPPICANASFSLPPQRPPSSYPQPRRPTYSSIDALARLYAAVLDVLPPGFRFAVDADADPPSPWTCTATGFPGR